MRAYENNAGAAPWCLRPCGNAHTALVFAWCLHPYGNAHTADDFYRILFWYQPFDHPLLRSGSVVGKYFTGWLPGVPVFRLAIPYLIFNQASNPIRVRTVTAMSATFLAIPTECISMNQVVIVLTVAGTLWLQNASALAQSKGQGAGPPAGAGSSVTHGVFGSIPRVGVISVLSVIPATALIAVRAAPGLAGTAPGLSGGNPGHGDSAPGQAGTSPGRSGNAHGQSGTATSHARPSSNRSGNSSGRDGSSSDSGGSTTGNVASSDSGATQVAQQDGGGQPAEAKRVSLHLIPSCN